MCERPTRDEWSEAIFASDLSFGVCKSLLLCLPALYGEAEACEVEESLPNGHEIDWASVIDTPFVDISGAHIKPKLPSD